MKIKIKDKDYIVMQGLTSVGMDTSNRLKASHWDYEGAPRKHSVCLVYDIDKDGVDLAVFEGVHGALNYRIMQSDNIHELLTLRQLNLVSIELREEIAEGHEHAENIFDLANIVDKLIQFLAVERGY